MENQIEKRVELAAPVARVWRALTDYREFGEWFRVNLEGPFVPGQVARGRVTHPGYEHVVWQAVGRGTLLVITESGFDHIPAHRRMEALRMNTMGWDAQTGNIAKHVSQGS